MKVPATIDEASLAALPTTLPADILTGIKWQSTIPEMEGRFNNSYSLKCVVLVETWNNLHHRDSDR